VDRSSHNITKGGRKKRKKKRKGKRTEEKAEKKEEKDRGGEGYFYQLKAQGKKGLPSVWAQSQRGHRTKTEKGG